MVAKPTRDGLPKTRHVGTIDAVYSDAALEVLVLEGVSPLDEVLALKARLQPGKRYVVTVSEYVIPETDYPF